MPRILLRLITVFISSPGDVPAERALIKNTVDSVNNIIAESKGILFKCIGWEDIPPYRAGRAQEVINEYVDKADIFIGMFYKRFGSSTGRYESGTEEEYERIVDRHEKEHKKPDIWMFFKGLEEKFFDDPGEQLKRVLDFKERIKKTDFYKDFDSAEMLRSQLENALVNWLRKHENEAEASPIDAVCLQDEHYKLLSVLIKNDGCTIEVLSDAANLPEDETAKAVDHLIDAGFVSRTDGTSMIHLPHTTEGFVTVIRHLQDVDRMTILFESESEAVSEYVKMMLEGHIEGILINRFHCSVPDEQLSAIVKMARMSKSVLLYILFGDTSFYDDIFYHNRKMNEDVGLWMRYSFLVHHMLLSFGQDCGAQETVSVWLDGKLVQGIACRIRAIAVCEEHIAYKLESLLALMSMKAETDIARGEPVSGSADVSLAIAHIQFLLEEPALAAQTYDRLLLVNGLEAKTRAIALNNRGHIYLLQGDQNSARRMFEEALRHMPDMTEAKENLARLSEPREA